MFHFQELRVKNPGFSEISWIKIYCRVTYRRFSKNKDFNQKRENKIFFNLKYFKITYLYI